MAFRVDRKNGQNFAENVIDQTLLFNNGSWTISSGTGTASLDNTNAFVGDRGLKVQNNTPANDIIASRGSQDTNFDVNGDYQLSWYVKKNIAQEVRNGRVFIYKNAALLDTQTFTIGSVDADEDINNEWVRFQSDVIYDITKGDSFTFQFQVDGIATGELTTTLYFDGVMMNKADRLNPIVPDYVKPTSTELYNQYTGWGNYADGTYTTGSAFSVTDGAAAVALPNDAAATLETQKPIDVDTFYDGTSITGRNGDGINITIEFKCRPTGAGANPRLTVEIDIGGAVNEIYTRDFVLSKGNGIEHHYLSSFNAYTLNTWEANGGTVMVSCDNENIEIYNIRYVITRTHKAR